MNRDLTKGDPQKVLWRFCLPLFGSVIFQQLYNVADSLIAGKLVGENALAAVGNSYEITLIFIAVAFGCNIGCSVIVSRFFGAGNYREMKTAISTSMISAGVMCLILMAVGLPGATFLLRMIHTPDLIMADSLLYLRIYILGVPFLFFYNMATGIFSALGDSKTPFLFLAFSSTANILMDILFVLNFRMGVSGVAWATFLCQGVSCILAVFFVKRRTDALKAEKKSSLFSRSVFSQFMMVAVPSILQQSFISVGNIMLQGIINSFGPGVIAGYAAGVKLNNLVITSFTTLGNGISNFTSQNLGAGKTDRISSGFRAGVKLIWTITLPVAVLYFFAGRYLLLLFMDETAVTAMQTGRIYLRILAPFYFVVSLKLVADGVLRGSTQMKHFIISTISDLILRVTLAYIFSSTVLGSNGIWCAWPVGWSAGTALSIYFYRSSLRKMTSKRI